jgi:predicted dithiol-disulfide oxidoreductase (DUF899 family)
MQNHKVVSRDEWIAARKQHLIEEKEFTRLRDQLSARTLRDRSPAAAPEAPEHRADSHVADY